LLLLEPRGHVWGLLVGLAAAGMIGLTVCLIVRPQQASWAALVVVLLLLLHPVILSHLGVDGLNDVSISWVFTALFGIIPLITLFVLLVDAK
jgi:hypothetical protein